MTGTSSLRFGRRSLLGGAAAAALAPFIPLLEAGAQQGSAVRRVCFFTTPNGLLSRELVPTGSENDFGFGRILAGLNPYKDDLLYLHGVDMKSFLVNPIPNDHPPVVNQLLTANDSLDPGDGSDPANSTSWFASSISIDQLIGDRLQQDPSTRTRFHSLQAGVQCGQFSWKQVFRGPRDPIFPENDPQRLFARVFGDLNPDGSVDPEALRRARERRSVIDGVLGELEAIRSRVGESDRHKIDAHLERIRNIEARLSEPDPGGVVCEPPDLDGIQAEDEYLRDGERQIENLVQAFACDLTRVATIQWANGASNHTFPSVSATTPHHELSHTEQGGAGSDVYEQLTGVGRWYADRFTSFVEKLAAIEEGDGTMLDNTLLVWTSEHNGARKGHDRDNLPFVLAGRCGGYFRTGRFLSYNGASHADLYVAIAHAMGFEDITSFGNPEVSSGPLSGLG